MHKESVIKVEDLSVSFLNSQGVGVRVVNQITFKVGLGRIVGLVGESGSGKSMTALTMMGLVPEPGKVEGKVSFRKQALLGLCEAEYQKLRGSKMAMVFQDPASALNPVLTIQEQLLEPIQQHLGFRGKRAISKAIEALRWVDLPEPEKRLKTYPHELSGGMKQRVMLAMALVCEPEFLILDEPTTALDVTVQAQIMDLIERIINVKELSILLISHDLGVISELADEVMVMYGGRIVESARTAKLLKEPRHPYTLGLINSMPLLGRKGARLRAIPGFPPDPSEIGPGCPFQPRCTRRKKVCQNSFPTCKGLGDHKYYCFNPFKNAE